MEEVPRGRFWCNVAMEKALHKGRFQAGIRGARPHRSPQIHERSRMAVQFPIFTSRHRRCCRAAEFMTAREHPSDLCLDHGDGMRLAHMTQVVTMHMDGIVDRDGDPRIRTF